MSHLLVVNESERMRVWLGVGKSLTNDIGKRIRDKLGKLEKTRKKGKQII